MASDAPLLLEVRSLGKQFPGVRALHEVDLSLAQGEVHAVIGENGAGKSTLIKVLGGAHQTDAGAIEIDQDISEGFKSFDVTNLMDFVGGNGLYFIGLSPPNELPTLDINYGQAYRSSEFGSTAAEISTRPMLVVEFIPEPATFAIIGLGGLALLRRNKK